MSSLAQQLEKLQTPQSSLLSHKRIKSSILFSSSECTKYSQETFYKIGHSGFIELLDIDESFSKFEKSFFSPAKIDFQRALESKEVNAELDIEIEEFLLLLSPFLQKQASIKALEWMIQRYSIESMNVNSLMMSIIPYYESSLFTRILQVVHIEDSNSPWKWLVAAKKECVSISKQTVFMCWNSNTWFRNFVSSYLIKMMKVHSVEANLNIAISFVITTQLGAVLSSRNVTENHLASICQTLNEGLSSNNSELLTGYCILLSQLSATASLSKSFVNTTLELLSKVKSVNKIMGYVARCIFAICVFQRVDEFSIDVIKNLSNNSKLMKQIKNLSEKKASACFYGPYVHGSSKYILEHLDELSEEKKIIRIIDLFSLIQELHLSSKEASVIISQLMKGLTSCKKSWNSLKQNIDVIQLWKELEKNHPEGCDLVQASNFKGFFSESVQLEEINNMNESKVCNLLYEDNAKVLSKTLKKGKEILHILGKDAFKEHLIRILHLCNSETGESWFDIEKIAMELLVNDVSKLLKTEERNELLYFLRPYVLQIYSDKKIVLAKIILKSFLAKKSVILQELKVEMKNCGSASDWMDKVWAIMPQVVTKMTVLQREELLVEVEKDLESMEIGDSKSNIFLLIMFFKSILSSDIKSCSTYHQATEKMFRLCLHSIMNLKIINEENNEKKTKFRVSKLMKKLDKNSILHQHFFELFEAVLETIDFDNENTNKAAYLTISDDPKDTFSHSLKIFVEVVSVVVKNLISSKNSQASKEMIDVMFMQKFTGLKQKLYFLSMIFGWRADINSSVATDANMKFWALKFSASLIKSCPEPDSLSWMLDFKEPLVLCSIPGLCDEGLLCAPTFQLLEQIMSNIGSLLKENILAPLIENLLAHKEEISADATYLPKTVASLVKDKPSVGRKIVKVIMKWVTEESLVPDHLKCSALFLLSGVDTPEILEQLFPLANSILDQILLLKKSELLDPVSSTLFYYIILRFSSKDAAFLKLDEGWKMFLSIMDITSPILQVSGKILIPQDLVVNYKVLRGISGSEKQTDILDTLITRSVKAQNPKESTKLKKELKKLSMEAGIINSLLSRYNTRTNVGSIREARAKRLKLNRNGNQSQEKDDGQSENWLKVSLVVELIGVMEELKEPWLLIKSLCHYLNQSLEIDSSAADIFQQQILSVMHHLIQVSIKESSHCELSQYMNDSVVVLSVQCIRQSVNPDTHRRALLILSMVAKFFPEKVLHNIMAIFSFMGNSLLRRDDSYSFQVIHQTITSIVPTIIKSEGSDANSLLKNLAQVTQVFVDALPDLADHRKLPLFTQLAQTLGVSQYLWLVMVLIADAYVRKGVDSKGGVPVNIQFALLLYSQFSVVDQLKASDEILNFACNLPEDVEIWKASRDASFSVVDMNIHSSKQLRQLKYSCIGLLGHLISSERFIGQVYELEKEEDSNISDFHGLLQDVLEKVLVYVKIVTNKEESERNKPLGKFWHDVQRKLMDLIQSVNSLLPPSSFVNIIKNLMTSKTSLIRSRAIEFLASKLQSDSKFFTIDDVDVLTPFLVLLVKVVDDPTEAAENRQISLFTVHLLIRFLGEHVDSSLIVPVLVSCIKLMNPSDSISKVETQAILVVAECVTVMKVHCIPYLGLLVPNLYDILNRFVTDTNIDSHASAAATAFYKVVESIPKFIEKKSLRDLLYVTCKIISKLEREQQKESRMCTKVAAIQEQLIEKTDHTIMINTIGRTFKRISAEGQSSLPSLFAFVEKLVASIDVSEIINYKQDLIKLLTSAFDVRQAKEPNKILLSVEESVISAASRFLLRLNEDDNVTIFSGFVNWAWTSQDTLPGRLITFFRFANCQAHKLQDLFVQTRLADRVLDYAGKVLNLNNNVLNEHGSFGVGQEAEENSCELLNYTLSTIEATFLYDRHIKYKFTTPERFNSIVTPLVDQIDNTIGGELNYNTRITKHVKPTVIALMNSVEDDSLWKELNRQLLYRIKADEKSMIVLAALEIFDGLIDSKGEDYLQPLLADTMPSITEILVSDDSLVEERTKEIFNKMERILGDNLRAYLDT